MSVGGVTDIFPQIKAPEPRENDLFPIIAHRRLQMIPSHTERTCEVGLCLT